MLFTFRPASLLISLGCAMACAWPVSNSFGKRPCVQDTKQDQQNSTQDAQNQAAPGAKLQDSDLRASEQQGGQPGNTQQATQQATGAVAKQKMLDEIGKLIPGSYRDSSELKSEFRTAIDLFAESKVDEAKAKLDEIKANHEEIPPGDYILGGMFMAVGNAQAGLQRLETAAKEFPDYPSIYLAFARMSITQGRFTDAFALATVAQLRLDTGTWSQTQRELFRLGILDIQVDVEIKRQQWEATLEHLAELKQLKPENSRFSLLTAQVYFEQGEVDKSLENLRITKKLEEKRQQPEVTLADWFLIKQDIDESRKWMEKAVADYPDDSSVFLNYSRWLLSNNELGKAAQAAQKAGELGADKYQTTFLRGQVAFTRRDYGVAEQHFSNLVQYKPADVEASNLYTLSLIESNAPEKKDRALQLASMNARMYPRNAAILSTLGWVLFKTGNVQQAQQVFQQVANVRPMTPTTSFFLASFLAKNNDNETAKRFLDASLNNKGYFIYRSAAQELKRTIDSKPTELPEKTESSPGKASPNKGGLPEKNSDGKDG